MFITPKFPHRVSQELKMLIFAKKKAYMVCKCTGCSLDYNMFFQLRAKCKKSSLVDYANFINTSEKSLSSLLVYFCRYVNSLNLNSTIPCSVRLDNAQSNSNSSSTNLFNKYFTSTINPPIILSSHPTLHNQLSYVLPSDIIFSLNDVLSALNLL